MSNEATAWGGDEPGGVRRHVLSLLRGGDGLSRVGLARWCGVSATTITRVVAQLLDEGCVVETGTLTRRGVGRPATRVSLVPTACGVVGVHIGGGSVRLGLVDLLGHTLLRDGFDFDTTKPADHVLAELASRVERLAVARGPGTPDRVLGVGVAVPGPVDEPGRRLLMPMNLPWRDVPVADVLETAVGLPVVVEHNVRAMALAEARNGLGQDLASVAYVYLRTGLGAGLVIAGKAFQGGVHGALEIGHLQIVEGGAPCVCGGRGCLETAVGEAALRALLERAGVEPGASDPFPVLVAAAEQDKALAVALDRIVADLATGLSALVNLLTPEVIVLGGALSQVPDSFVDRLAEATRAAVFPVIRPAVRLEKSSLLLDPGVDGGAAAALDRFFYV